MDTADVNSYIGERIRDLRNRNGLTQQELADRTELTKGFISQLERGQVSASVVTLFDLIECLGTTPAEFFRNEDEKVVFSENTVGIGCDPLGALLGDRHKGGIAVDCCRRGKDKLLAAVFSHHITERERGIQIVAVIFDGHTGGFADSLIARKMDHGINLLFFKNLFETLAVTNVLLIKFRAFTCDLLDAVNHHLLGIVEIVSDHHIVSCIQKLHNRVASDKSCSACH